MWWDRQVAAYRDRDPERFLALLRRGRQDQGLRRQHAYGWAGGDARAVRAAVSRQPAAKSGYPRRIVTGDYVIDEEYGSGIVIAEQYA